MKKRPVVCAVMLLLPREAESVAATDTSADKLPRIVGVRRDGGQGN